MEFSLLLANVGERRLIPQLHTNSLEIVVRHGPIEFKPWVRLDTQRLTKDALALLESLTYCLG